MGNFVQESYERACEQRDELRGTGATLPPRMVETGRKYITPCCTAATVEYRDESGALFLRCHVAGHGWTSDYFAGSVDEINDTGVIVEVDGTERSVFWKPE